MVRQRFGRNKKTTFFEAAYAFTVARMFPDQQGGFDECSLIQVDEGLRVNDCQGCKQRKFCGYRSHSLVERHRPLLPAVEHIEWLDKAAKLIPIQGLAAWELRYLIPFQMAVDLAIQRRDSEEKPVA